ncbi:ABC transporter substrate-binding protein [Marinobacter alexandrii]|jgi:polar amino acid transport system substrate-binding protein|uniref:substrate-binding periplasmic protein n=1 Tax=Marinobacter alexandrii TaxID=2570351 RepID=UPI002ABE2C25|nr:ABC transporter substrate-binding protein [Marinobacter alexandrii]
MNHRRNPHSHTDWSRTVVQGVWLLFFALLAPAFALSEETAAKTLRIAYVEFPPITFHNEAGEADGELIDITRKVVREAGYVPDFIHLPISRVYLYLKSGRIDLWPGLTNIPSLHGDVLESWVSPMPIQLSVWYCKDKGRPLEHFDQLSGKTVIVIAGYTYGGLINWLNRAEDIRITEAPNHRAAINMLKRNRGDYLLDYRQPVEQTLIKPSDDHILQSEVRTRNAAWLFSLAHPRAAILREEFDDAYLRLVEAGEVPPLRDQSHGFLIPGFPEPYR